jgi:hypothetical protein
MELIFVVKSLFFVRKRGRISRKISASNKSGVMESIKKKKDIHREHAVPKHRSPPGTGARCNFERTPHGETKMHLPNRREDD